MVEKEVNIVYIKNKFIFYVVKNFFCLVKLLKLVEMFILFYDIFRWWIVGWIRKFIEI